MLSRMEIWDGMLSKILTNDPLETAKPLSRCWNAFTTTSIPQAVTTTTTMQLHVMREPYWVHITHSWVCGFKIPALKLIWHPATLTREGGGMVWLDYIHNCSMSLDLKYNNTIQVATLGSVSSWLGLIESYKANEYYWDNFTMKYSTSGRPKENR